MTHDVRKAHDQFSAAMYKDRERVDATHSDPVPCTPMTPLTPVKAAQFLGLNAEAKATESPKVTWSLDDGLVDDPVVRPGLRAQKSMPLLTRIKLGTEKIKFKEEIAETDSPKPKKDLGGGSHKAKRMLDFLPSFGSSKRAAANQDVVADLPRSMSEEDDITDSGYRSDYEHHVGHRALTMLPHENQPVAARRRRKKDPKVLERMSPITETSFDDLRALRDHSEDHDTELEVISEYEDNPSQFSPDTQPRSTKKLPKSLDQFQLDDSDLSPTVEYTDDEAVQPSPYAMHPGTKIDPRKLHSLQDTAVPTQSPLQAIESRLLDECEENLAKIDSMEAERLERDRKVAKMKRDHEEFKESFHALKQHFDGNHDKCDEKDCNHNPVSKPGRTGSAEDSDEFDDLVSLRSSIDLDEEPTVHVARAMTITRVTPGMVKLVDISPRKNKGKIAAVGENTMPPAIVKKNTAPLIGFAKNADPSIGFNKTKAPLVHAGRSIALPINVKNKPRSMGAKSKAVPVNIENKTCPSASVENSKISPFVNAKTNKSSSSVGSRSNGGPPRITISQHPQKQSTFYIDGSNEAGSTNERGENIAVSTISLEQSSHC
jgi:hypothetical protein